ncbi:uncharacterized protein K02A2.6-like [Melitaea cinxia]|uniref:uncharacterized protein K02A2.6-like n=1 Tax=Melitaea cinxia TaxID=113334 RepID=UPI001E274CBF|nr:uncharacterized protein K02A2.6-like [Melitaea cinxia]
MAESAQKEIIKSSGIMGLKPPTGLKNLSMEEYKKFIQRFEIYRLASGANSESSEVQTALLLHCMGEEAQDIHATFDFAKGEAYNYEKVITKFNEYFIPRKNESVNSHLFFTRNQKEGETFDSFYTDIKKLSTECEFGNLLDRMLKDRIVTGILDKRLKDRLLRESDLTLSKAIQICKAAELAEEQIKKISNEPGTSAVQSIRKKNEKGTVSERETRNPTDKRRHTRTDRDSRHRLEQRNTENRYSEKNKKQEGQRAEKKFDCSRCGFHHSERRCPAYGKKCMKCGKMNHFARKCRARDAVKAIQESESSDSESCHMYIINISNVNLERNWYEYVYFTELNRNLKFKLDSGAQCNVISANDCYRLGISKFEKSNCKLTSYSNEKIETLGKIKLSVKINDQIQKIEFQVCKGNYIPILGLPTLIKFKLIQRTNNENISSVQTEKLELLEKYKDVFKGIGEIKDYEYDIQLKEGWQGKIERNRHIPFKLKDKLKEELSKLEKIGIISKAEGPTDFVSSLVMTTKPGGAMRICLDPQYLNTQIKREQMMIPNVDEIIAKLKGSNYFSTLDANKRFWMIKLTKNSKNLTTFNTPFGRFYFNSFGLASSPEVFHRIFSEIFKDIDGVELYIDDILIHAKTEAEHDRILEQKEVKYLGHVLTTEGIKIDQNRIKAIVEMKEPKTQKEILRFLGMINYVARFIPNVSEITAPLRQLIKKDVPFLWSKEQDKAYKTLKKLLIEPPVLSYFDMNKQIVLSVDASKAGLGAVILQEGKPIAYGSRAMTETEIQYSQIEKECLAILYGITKFHQYLYGNQFKVETDHRPLVSIFSKPLNRCPARLQKMRMALQPYSFELNYKPGKELLVADHLSRSHLLETEENSDLKVETHVAMIMESYRISDKKLEELILETAKDEELMAVNKYIMEGWPENKSLINSKAKIFYSYRDELSNIRGLIVKGRNIVIPQSKRKEVLENIHYAHLGIEKSKVLARNTVFWPNMNKEIEDLIQNCDTCKSFQNANKKESMIEKEIPQRPWEILSIDIFFLYSKPYILLVDAYSKYVEIQPLNNLYATSTIDSIKEILARHGIPDIVYTDAGTQFTSFEFKTFSKEWNFKHKVISPKHHQGNGLAERYIQTVKKLLKKLIYDKKDIYLGLLMYRNTPVNTDGKSPSELLFKRNIKTILPRLDLNQDRKDKYRQELLNKQEIQKKYYNRGSRNLPELREGEIVKIQDENCKKPHESGIVLGKGSGPRSYQVRNESGNILTRNRRMLIKGGKYYDKSRVEDQGNCEESERQEVERHMIKDRNIQNNVIPRENYDGSSGQVNYNNDTYGSKTSRSGRLIKRPSYLKDFV